MFTKATKEKIKVRLALSGASGSGKTYSALAIASHLATAEKQLPDIQRDRLKTKFVFRNHRFLITFLLSCRGKQFSDSMED